MLENLTSKDLFESPDISGKDIQLQTQHGKFMLWVGSPGVRCGHRASDATSYFDGCGKGHFTARTQQTLFFVFEKDDFYITPHTRI